jgi:hypothetical protein
VDTGFPKKDMRWFATAGDCLLKNVAEKIFATSRAVIFYPKKGGSRLGGCHACFTTRSLFWG